VGAVERDTQKNYTVKDNESVSAGKPTVEVAFGVVFEVELLKDMKVGQGKNHVDADKVHTVHVKVPPDLKGKLHTGKHYESRLG